MHYSKIPLQSPDYPSSLKEIHLPPTELFYLGKLTNYEPMVAIVGSRLPTDYGRQVTYRLAYDLAKAGLTIVSGLAYGIDAIAHQAALEAGGRTVAVLAGGLDKIYPAANRNLAKQIAKQGMLISEYSPGTDSLRQYFPARNRLIAGLSQGTIVTEAAAASGSLITANFALQQNRLVMAVPGNITSLMSAGPNNLLKSGATPVTDAADVLAALNYRLPAIAKTKPQSKDEAKIYELIAEGVTSTHDLIERSGMDASQFANVISLMEITGKIRNLGAGQWSIR